MALNDDDDGGGGDDDYQNFFGMNKPTQQLLSMKTFFCKFIFELRVQHKYLGTRYSGYT